MSKGRSGIAGQAREIVGQYSLSSLTNSKNKIVDFYRSVDKNGGIRIEDGKIKVSKDAMAQANELAETLSRRMVMRDAQAQQDYSDLRADLRGTYTISDKDSANIPDFRRYLRSSDNFLRIGKTGTSIDTKYQELAGQYPQYFSSGITNQAEQLQEINNVLNSLRNSTRAMPREWQNDSRQDLRNDIIRGYLVARRGRRAG